MAYPGDALFFLSERSGVAFFGEFCSLWVCSLPVPPLFFNGQHVLLSADETFLPRFNGNPKPGAPVPPVLDKLHLRAVALVLFPPQIYPLAQRPQQARNVLPLRQQIQSLHHPCQWERCLQCFPLPYGTTLRRSTE